MKIAPFSAPLDVRALRQSLDMNQTEFWTGIHVTQSGGSRYENDRGMPAQVAELVRLFYVEGIDTTLIVDDMAEKVRAVLTSGEIDAAIAEKVEQLAALEARADRITAAMQGA